MPTNDRPSPAPRASHLLSKSKYIRGLQCERALWLDVHHPTLARYSREQMRRFDYGRDFELAFKAQFPDAADLSALLKRDIDAYPALTAQLLDAPPANSIFYSQLSIPNSQFLFEAGFLYDDVLVLADVVRRRADGSLDIYEVKSGNSLNDTYKHDAAVQFYVISHCRTVNSFSIVYNGTDGQDGQFTTVDLTRELTARLGSVARHIGEMKAIVLSTAEPDTPTGSHCLNPYPCPYQHYCRQGTRQMSLF